MKVTIKRQLSTDEGVFGQLTTEGGFSCATGELPWRNNAPNRSCIPAGTYKVAMAWSPKHKRQVYHVLDVPDRSVVEIHSANLVGDVEKGYLAQVQGCIAPGADVVTFDQTVFPGMTKDQRGVSSSAITQTALESHLRGQPFDLEILWVEEKA